MPCPPFARVVGGGMSEQVGAGCALLRNLRMESHHYVAQLLALVALALVGWICTGGFRAPQGICRSRLWREGDRGVICCGKLRAWCRAGVEVVSPRSASQSGSLKLLLFGGAWEAW